MKMLRPMFSICSLLEVKLRRCILMCVTSLLSRIQCNVSKRATLLLSKLYAWIDKLDGRSMLSLNQFLKISSTFPTEKTRILSPTESYSHSNPTPLPHHSHSTPGARFNTKDLIRETGSTFKKKTLSRM